MSEEQQTPLLYQDMVEEILYESLASDWIRTNISSFSDSMSLFDYQQDAIKSAVKLLYYYFESLQKYEVTENESTNIERKKKFFNEMSKFEKHLANSLGVTNKRNRPLFDKLKQYYSIIRENSHERIHFLNFVNRMSFWMATGSGKTIVLIKLVELLDRLKQSKVIPDNDILILTHREDLVDQIRTHINEFNKKAARKIELWELNRYDDVKHGNVLTFKDQINIFLYRSDLISEETKEKLLSFEDFENDGRWYILLDEAHKGDKEDSKRQIYYSLLTRNGFLFNFSATFTDPWDIITTVYNFNLDNFIRKGYGKNVYLSQQELSAFKDETDFNGKGKQKIVLKSLIFLTLTKAAKNNIDRKIDKENYHNPLLVSLVNSVNIQDSDLEIFFKELEKIAMSAVDRRLFEEAKEELIQELTGYSGYVFGNECMVFDEQYIKKIDMKEILKQVFNATSSGHIEIIKIPQNKEELIFKLKTSDRPFALIKIGDISKWLKDKLNGYEVNESYENESFFKAMNEDNNPVNILMGSRAFYEGWDTNRPNVMIFINIGKTDAKKYVSQSIGRGIRIEPVQKKRKRLLPLRRENNVLAKEFHSQLSQNDVSLIETLFVLGTNKKNVQYILESIKYERKTSGEIIELKENEEIKNKEFLIPVYKDKTGEITTTDLPKFEGNKELLSSFLDWLGDERLIYALFSNEDNANPQTMEKSREFIKNGSFHVFEIGDVYSQMMKLMKHVNITLQDLEKFKPLDSEIVHFKRIRVTLTPEEFKRLRELIDKVRDYKDPSKKEKELDELLDRNKISRNDYKDEIKKLGRSSNEEEFTANNSTLRIKHLLNHYYVPIIISEKEKVDYINHIINVESEKRFMKQLELSIQCDNNPLNRFDWWMFCKLDEHLDDIFIPYYNKEHNKIERFKPDFIFWLKRENEYFIAFVDPKGTMHTDYQFKVDGYKSIFEENNRKKQYLNNELSIQVHLFLFTDDINKLPEGYKKYWFDEFEKIVEQVYRHMLPMNK